MSTPLKLIMTSLINLPILFSIVLLFPLSANAQDTLPKLKQLWTLEEVKEMAKKYNLQDSVGPKKNNFLLYTKRRSIEKYFQQVTKDIQMREEFKAYLAKTKNVRTYEEFENLLNSFPNVKAVLVESQGGEDNYKKYMKESRNYTWRIYRNKDGGLAFFRADEAITEGEFQCGQRIDNLPKTK